MINTKYRKDEHNGIVTFYSSLYKTEEFQVTCIDCKIYYNDQLIGISVPINKYDELCDLIANHYDCRIDIKCVKQEPTQTVVSFIHDAYIYKVQKSMSQTDECITCIIYYKKND